MDGTRWTRVGQETEGTAAERWRPWHEAGGALALVAALALWGVVLVGVMSPLGDALARLEGRGAPAAASAAAPAAAQGAQPCAVPAGAVAVAAAPATGRRCR
jgi:hypothetical protein